MEVTALFFSHLNRVNSISSVVRTITEVKHKWQDLQLKSKKKESERNRLQNLTGGGPAPPALTPLELKVELFCCFIIVVVQTILLLIYEYKGHIKTNLIDIEKFNK